MPTQENRFDPGQILMPAYPGPLNRLAPVGFGASLTITKGQAVARKTSDGLFYPLNLAATDGTQTFGGFSQYTFMTDANKLCYLLTSGTAAGSFYGPGSTYMAIYTGGIFDPSDLITAATGTVTAEVDTITPTNPTTGDIYTVGNASGDVASFTVGATQTATATVTGLTAAWNANPVLKALATASGTATLILTAKTAGQPLNLIAGVTGTGTTALVITTPAVAAQTAEVDTFTATNPTTGDVYTLTATFPGLQTRAISATVGATQTATAIDALLKAAWNADPILAAYATATGTATLILTGVNPGQTLSVAGTVVGTGTIAKVVTTPAFGRNIADILPGCPGARVLQPSGFWEVP